MNDPSDCLAEYEYGTKEECDSWLNYMEYIANNEEEKKAFRETRQKLLDNGYNFESTFKKEKEGKGNETLKICCFSSAPKNILLWSHYADKHKGICIGFKTLQNSDKMYLHTISQITLFNGRVLKDVLPVIKIIYGKMPQPYNLFNLNGEEIKPFLTTKCSLWKYEKERRIILNDNSYKEKNIKFNKNILSKILFGIYTKDRDKNTIYDVIKKKYIDEGFDVKFYQTSRIRHTYNLEIKSLNIE